MVSDGISEHVEAEYVFLQYALGDFVLLLWVPRIYTYIGKIAVQREKCFHHTFTLTRNIEHFAAEENNYSTGLLSHNLPRSGPKSKKKIQYHWRVITIVYIAALCWISYIVPVFDSLFISCKTISFWVKGMEFIFPAGFLTKIELKYHWMSFDFGKLKNSISCSCIFLKSITSHTKLCNSVRHFYYRLGRAATAVRAHVYANFTQKSCLTFSSQNTPLWGTYESSDGEKNE